MTTETLRLYGETRIGETICLNQATAMNSVFKDCILHLDAEPGESIMLGNVFDRCQFVGEGWALRYPEWVKA